MVQTGNHSGQISSNMKTLSKVKTDKFDKLLTKAARFTKINKLSKEEKVELRSYSIKKELKIGKIKV